MGPVVTVAVRTPMFCTTVGSMVIAPGGRVWAVPWACPGAPPGDWTSWSSYTGMRSIPIGLLPGLSEIYGGFSIGSHQYLTFRFPPAGSAAGPCAGIAALTGPTVG